MVIWDANFTNLRPLGKFFLVNLLDLIHRIEHILMLQSGVSYSWMLWTIALKQLCRHFYSVSGRCFSLHYLFLKGVFEVRPQQYDLLRPLQHLQLRQCRGLQTQGSPRIHHRFSSLFPFALVLDSFFGLRLPIRLLPQLAAINLETYQNLYSLWVISVFYLLKNRPWFYHQYQFKFWFAPTRRHSAPRHYPALGWSWWSQYRHQIFLGQFYPNQALYLRV